MTAATAAAVQRITAYNGCHAKITRTYSPCDIDLLTTRVLKFAEDRDTSTAFHKYAFIVLSYYGCLERQFELSAPRKGKGCGVRGVACCLLYAPRSAQSNR